MKKVDNGEIQTHVQCGLSPVLIHSSGAPWTQWIMQLYWQFSCRLTI